MKGLIALLATTAVLGVAAQPFPMKPDFQRGLGVSAETAAKLDALIAKEREQRQALHEKTRAEMAKLLTPEQVAKLDEARAARGPGRGPGWQGGGPGAGRGYGMGPGMGMHYGMGPGMGMHRGMGPGGPAECPMWDAKPAAQPAPAK